MDHDCRFSICDYFRYVDGTVNSRVVFEGEQVLNSGHIILCGITEQESHFVNIYALCLQTTSLQSSPHKIEGTFLISDEDCQVKHFLCSCKAGKSGRCKHISAVLLLCTRTSLNKLEAISQTDIACAWSKKKDETKEKYQAIPVAEMECLKKNNNCKSYDVSETTLREIQTNFITALPSSALSLHKIGRRQLQVPMSTALEDDVIKNILNNACQSVLMMELMQKKVDFVASCCEEVFKNKFDGNAYQILCDTKTSKRSWLSERQFRVTGSRIYEIFTYCGKDWSIKSSKYFYPKSFTNKYVKHGLQQEASARSLFEQRTGLTVMECGFIISEFNPWLGYSPDGLVMDNNQYPAELIEIKCPFEGNLIY
ncbi:hypothetical protein RI129_001081 [Pyrocoelia pectoralis]|uniref:SWIM-type domain-containing protein n=1 Tax=Pyrocoelia pectoralis TaxID=417401 RepID=A0AAN7VK33_9COLE